MTIQTSEHEIEAAYAAELLSALEAGADLFMEEMHLEVHTRGNQVVFKGEAEAIERGWKLCELLKEQLKKGCQILMPELKYLIKMSKEDKLSPISHLKDEVVAVTARGKKIFARTIGQQTYLDSIRNNVLTFGIGPAGTGKTYLAVAMAVAALQSKEVCRLVLTRPAVEAGEKLGFLPGDLQEKVDPYLRPLYDALHDIMGAELFQKNFERGVIEIAPLAYMRGRTLDDAFIILDEAQNTTFEQMKMFLTRLGFGSKAVVTGDITQIDLPRGVTSGLANVNEIFAGVKDIGTIELNDSDVVRHELVQRIIRAYERYGKAKKASEGVTPIG